MPCLFDRVHICRLTALNRFGRPETLNTDQRAQFTLEAFTGALQITHGITVGVDGKVRWMGNVFVKRLWRTLTREDVYLSAYDTPKDLG